MEVKQKALAVDKSRIDSVIYGEDPDESENESSIGSIFPLIILAFLFFFTLQINKIVYNFKSSHRKTTNDNAQDTWGMSFYRIGNTTPMKLHPSDLNHAILFKKKGDLLKNRDLLKKNPLKEVIVDKVEEAVKLTSTDNWSMSSSSSNEENVYKEQTVPELIRNGEIIKGGTAILILLTNQEEVDKLSNSLRTLPFLSNDDPDALAPVLIFCQEGKELTSNQKGKLALSTNRPIVFPIIENYDTEPSNHELWISKLNNHPSLRHFKILLKLNPNFCFRTFNDQLPSFELSYQAPYIGYTDLTKNQHVAIIDLVNNYVKGNKITPKNEKMWDFLMNTTTEHKYLPAFDDKFEVIHKDTFYTRDILDWYAYLQTSDLLKKELYGVIQFITVALFLKDEEIRTTNPVGFYYGDDDCRAEDVELSLAYLY